MDQRSPYYSSTGVAETRLSVVAFVDLLGFTDEIKRAYAENRAGELLNRLRSALDIAYIYLQHPLYPERRVWELKAFTDNIVIGYPIRRDGESELGDTFGIISNFQLEMIKAGFFVRGGISVGEIYMDDSLVFGNGLLEAYDAEDTLARDPRVVLTSSAADYVKTHLSYYSEIEHSPQYRSLLRDADGQLFLNYLQDTITVAQESGPYKEMLLRHKAMVEARLERFVNNTRIWSKYSWAGNYHNFFCNQFSFLDEAYLIDEAKLRLSPKLLD